MWSHPNVLGGTTVAVKQEELSAPPEASSVGRRQLLSETVAPAAFPRPSQWMEQGGHLGTPVRPLPVNLQGLRVIASQIPQRYNMPP